MRSKDKEHKAERIDKVAALLRKRLGGDEADTAERFIRNYYDGVALDDLADQSIENLYGAALSLWKFAERHSGEEAKIRVYNPRVEEHGWQSPHTIVEVIHDDMPFLVDSVSAEFERGELDVHLLVHPIVYLRRDREGRVSIWFAIADDRHHTVSDQ